MMDRKTTRKSAPAPTDDKVKAARGLPAKERGTPIPHIGREHFSAPEDDGDHGDRLRTVLRASGVAPSLVKPIGAAVAKLIALSASNRSGLQACLNFIGARPSSALPAEPPEYFRNRPVDPETGKRETIVKFLERVWYTPWIAERLLTRTELRRLDLPAATALNNFLHAPKQRWEPKNELPPHLVVPTKSEVNDSLLEDADKVREARRIVDARWRRQRGLVRGKK